MSYKKTTEREEQVAERIVDAAYKVHKALGPGLLEKVYEVCFCHELTKAGFSYKRQIDVGLAQNDIVPLGLISVELINEVSHRHAFWVITEAALDSLGLNTETRERISAELSKIVPLPSEGEIADHKNRFNSLSRTLRKT